MTLTSYSKGIDLLLEGSDLWVERVSSVTTEGGTTHVVQYLKDIGKTPFPEPQQERIVHDWYKQATVTQTIFINKL